MTEEDEIKFKDEKSCRICNEKYLLVYKQQVKDLDHYTGKYIGSAHRESNAKFYYEHIKCIFS